MIRLTVLTAICLTLVSVLLNWLIADPTMVGWQECRIQDRQLSVTLTNKGGADWDGYMVRARVYADETIIAGTAPRKMVKQAAGEAREIRLLLDRKLPDGREYRVQVFLQREKEAVVAGTFRVAIPKDLERVDEASVDGVEFPEIRALRTQIQDGIGRDMGLRPTTRIGRKQRSA